ncbi:MAG TPA: amidohydrolase family protein [Phycisphaerae bacterium]|nr:amidohydrolase family protein [Phycisphaerae bacterium]
MPFLLSADSLAPLDPSLPPLLHNAALVIEPPHIAAIGHLPDLRRSWGNLPHTHLPGLLLPAFVNAHTHLELSYLRAADLAATHFTRWVANLMAAYPPPDQLPSVIANATRAAIHASLDAGVSTLGDISRHPHFTRPILSTGPLRTLSFGEIVSLGKMRQRLDPLLANAMDTSHASPHLHIGLSPHAPYTVESSALARIVTAALAHKVPIAIHLAELADETPFLRDLSGPLGKDWDLLLKLDILDAAIPTHPDGPIPWAADAGLLQASSHIPILLAHVNYCSDHDLSLLAASQASVAYCPRTHAYFGHPPTHRYRDMLAANINLCLATDSLASNPDLSPLNEARFLYDRDHTDPLTLLQMITLNPARALGLAHLTGSLTPNKSADLVHFPLSSSPQSSNPLHTLLQSNAPPSTLYLAGTRVR